jgi:hypothetical protein
MGNQCCEVKKIDKTRKIESLEDRGNLKMSLLREKKTAELENNKANKKDLKAKNRSKKAKSGELMRKKDLKLDLKNIEEKKELENDLSANEIMEKLGMNKKPFHQDSRSSSKSNKHNSANKQPKKQRSKFQHFSAREEDLFSPDACINFKKTDYGFSIMD